MSTSDPYKVFVSHGRQDLWLAGQIAKEMGAVGAVPFLDQTNIPKASPNFKFIIRDEIAVGREFVALFTPWSAVRSWVWVEMGAAWSKGIPILAVFYGMSVDDLDKGGQGKAILEDVNIVGLDDLPAYLGQLGIRVKEAMR